ncbi:MAG TPA: hypothetical protein VHE35_06610 [Kofleriaceae bacterium]|nr:hypothetical protein [Kofleriaceae bacterium]
MTTTRLVLSATASLLLVAALSARAHAQVPAGGGVCVVIDASTDTLADNERTAARSLILQAFASEKVNVDATGSACAETYTVSNVKLGNTITVTMTGPRGQRTARATSLDDLGPVYSQMVKSLVTGAPMETGGGAQDRSNVTRDQASPRRVTADGLKYISLGYGAVLAGHVNRGPAFGFGYRYELDRLALDVSLSFLIANDGDGVGVTGAYPRLGAVWYQKPIADSSPYYGAALSYGGVAAADSDGNAFAGSGLQGHLLAGYEAFRSSTIRFFGQADLTLPFYTSTSGDFNDGETHSKYTPSISLSIGVGWGKSNTIRVVNDNPN